MPASTYLARHANLQLLESLALPGDERNRVVHALGAALDVRARSSRVPLPPRLLPLPPGSKPLCDVRNIPVYRTDLDGDDDLVALLWDRLLDSYIDAALAGPRPRRK